MRTLQKSINQLKLHCTLLAVALIISSLFMSTFAQLTPSDCTQGCTSNDVQIKAAYLSNAQGVKLGTGFVCPQNGIATVYLTLELTTNTPRVGVAIYTNIKALDANGEPTGDPIESLSECFGIALNQPTNKVTFQNDFDWECGTAIALTDVFIGWGTGNKNFCTGSAFQCPATPSKCYQLPGDKFIAIETPNAQNNSSTKCSDASGGTTATFDLTSIQVTTSSDVTVTWWDDYTAPSTFSNQIMTPASYSTASNTVFAKITSNSDASVYSVSEVTLTVYQTPLLIITNPSAVCSPNTVDITAASVTSGSTLPAGTTLKYYQNNGGSLGSEISSLDAQSLGNGTYWIKATTNTTPACSDQKQVVVTVNTTPGSPNVTYLAPACDETTFKVRVNSPTTGVTYSIKDKNGNAIAGVKVGATTTSSYEAPNSNNFEFSNIPAGSGYQVTATSGNCSSGETSCGTPEEIGSTRSQGSEVQENNVTTQEIIIPSSRKLGIKAFPNPYNDVIRFVINSEESGQGRLELFNMLGQKVKTVYQGNIAVGVQNYEVSVPAQHRSTLIYIMTLNGKQFTGKLLNSSK
jgi:hypothetical protein